MSATARSEVPLDTLLNRAGAVYSTRPGRRVAIHFGSAAAELSVCVRAVGLVERSELSTLSLEAPAAQLSALMTRLAGAAVAPGGLVCGRSAWWCGVAEDRAMVVCRAPTGARLAEALHGDAARHLTVRDLSEELAAIGVLGRNAGSVLSALGAYGPSGDARTARPFALAAVDGIPAWWLLQSDRQALALVSREHAGEVWLAIERAGRPFGISCVGEEAASRYALIERSRPAALARI